jgi:anti-sigma regulatory factor (Ser/Thr protein kinase)
MERVAAYGYTGQELADIETAIGEALANAAEHGHRPGGVFDVAVYVEGGAAVIEVLDEGAGFAHEPDPVNALPPPDIARGFGIFLMRRLMDGLEFEEHGRRVRLRKHLPGARASAR